MTNRLSKPMHSRYGLVIAIVGLAMVLMALPALASAAIYAYVNQSGEVQIVTANDPYSAMATAPNIDEHSGVMLLTNPADPIVGDRVQVI